MKLKSGILFIVISFSSVCITYNLLAEKKILDNQQEELYNEILRIINIEKKKDNIEVYIDSQLDSSLICFDKIKNYNDGKIIKIFYHDSENVYFDFDELYRYLENNNYQTISNCMADGPDGTSQLYLKNRLMLLLTAQWDGGDDSDTTYIPSKYFEMSFYLMKLNQPDSEVIYNISKY